MGSCRIFDDEFLEKEDNSKLQEILFNYLLNENNVKIDPNQTDDTEISE